jgi:protein-disulfide isomerase
MNCGTAIIWMLAIVTPATAIDCNTLSASTRAALATYVQQQFDIHAPVQILSTETNAATCYTKVSFRTAESRPFVMYLTPDHRFVTGKLFDLSIDPTISRREEEREASELLASGNAPSRGDVHAPVVFVEFGDFECPFCKQVADLMSKLSVEDSAKVRLIYRQMPLSSHPWSHKASEIATCTYISGGPDVFWRMHEYIFQEQTVLTAVNVESQLLTYATDKLLIDPVILRRCVANKGYSAALATDDDLAQRYSVEGTPTLYVNGKLSAGFKTLDQLRKIIHEADTGDLDLTAKSTAALKSR